MNLFPQRTACSAVAVLLHYFLLSSFSWMLIEGALLFVKAVFIFHRELHPFKVMALGWGKFSELLLRRHD